MTHQNLVIIQASYQQLNTQNWLVFWVGNNHCICLTSGNATWNLLPLHTADVLTHFSASQLLIDRMKVNVREYVTPGQNFPAWFSEIMTDTQRQ